jgi:BirA family biotin operon repressor/biotin-[acetyl-CoA-carboxylase] ligase
MRTVFLDRVDSTNEFLKQKVQNRDFAPFLAVLADEQTAGKGRLGRQWWSRKGDSLILSLLLPGTDHDYQLGMVAGLAAVEVFRKHYQLNAQLKWPNDVYMNTRKIAGVLLEKVKNQVILGIGINLNQDGFPQEISGIAVSLKQIIQKETEILFFYRQFQNFFLNFYIEWRRNSFSFIRNRVSPMICWKGKTVSIEFIGEKKENLTGILEGIDDSGFLILKVHDGFKKIMSGDVKLWLQD